MAASNVDQLLFIGQTNPCSDAEKGENWHQVCVCVCVDEWGFASFDSRAG